jgi:hypothetical protein
MLRQPWIRPEGMTMSSVDTDPRVEVAARALLRHRLASYHQVPAALEAKLGASLRRVEERLWPSLSEEARAVVKALDRAEAMSAGARRPGRASGLQSAAPGNQTHGDKTST